MSLITTLIGFVWSAFCCVFALCVILINKNAAKWVLIKIGKRMWSKNMVRIVSGSAPKVTFHGTEKPYADWPDQAIFIANHSSLLDINASASAIPQPIVYLSKDSIRRVPVLGLLNERVGTVFIDRSNPAAAKQSVVQLRKTLQNGISVIVYPEGTRTKDGRLQPFKKGAFHLAANAQVPIIPLHIHGTRHALPSGRIRIKRNPIHVRFGRPLLPPPVSNTKALNEFVQQGFDSVQEMKKWHTSHLKTPD